MNSSSMCEPSKIINVVWDLDGVWCDQTVGSNGYNLFMLKEGAILTSEGMKTHIIFPVVITALQLLHQTENVRQSIFTAHDGIRNDILPKCVLDLAFPGDEHQEMKKQFRVLSKRDLSPSLENHWEYFSTYDHRAGQYQKDISKVLREGELLENAFLIDDDLSYAAHGQLNNLLKVEATNDSSFIMLGSKDFSEDPTNDPDLLSCYFVDKIGKKSNPKYDRCLSVCKKENGYTIVFVDRESKQYREEPIPEAGNEELISDLEDAYEKLFEPNRYGQICLRKLRTRARLHELVESFGGHTDKIFHKANQIFYAIGMLFYCLEKSKLTGKSPTEILFQKQYRPNVIDGKEACRYRYFEMIKKDKYYYLGLEKLRQINPDLNFTTPQSYLKYQNMPISEEDRAILDKAKANEDKEHCTIQ